MILIGDVLSVPFKWCILSTGVWLLCSYSLLFYRNVKDNVETLPSPNNLLCIHSFAYADGNPDILLGTSQQSLLVWYVSCLQIMFFKFFLVCVISDFTQTARLTTK